MNSFKNKSKLDTGKNHRKLRQWLSPDEPGWGDQAGGFGPAHSPVVSHTGDPLHRCCWNYSTASLGQAVEKLIANGQIALSHSGSNRLEMWRAEASWVDTGIAHHGGRKGKAERNTTGTGFGGSFPFWRVLCDLKHIRQMLRMETRVIWEYIY